MDNSSAAPGLPPPDPILYRPNVAAILRNPQHEIFVAERINISGAWQFPQGGVDEGETHDEALVRELEEEIGVKPELVKIIEKRGGYRYAFSKGRLKYGIYGGQEQTYYLCDYLGTDADIRLDATHQEFSTYKWIKPAEFSLEWVPRFKRPVYIAVFKDFFGIALGAT
jgi:putative (di)nucleoside polyphosphate hydrolase